MELSDYFEQLQRCMADPEDVDENGNDSLTETPSLDSLEKRKKKNPDGTDRAKGDELGDFLGSAIRNARPKPLGNVKVCRGDRRAYWVESMAELKYDEQEDKQRIPPAIEETQAGTRKVYADGSHLVWEYGQAIKGYKKQ